MCMGGGGGGGGMRESVVKRIPNIFLMDLVVSMKYTSKAQKQSCTHINVCIPPKQRVCTCRGNRKDPKCGG